MEKEKTQLKKDFDMKSKKEIRKVYIAGGGGNVGSTIAGYLLEEGFEVYMLSKKTTPNERQKSLMSKGAKFVTLSSTSRSDEIAEKTKGADAIVSVVAGDSKVFYDYQMDLLHAAKLNNVKLFIPSEFGIDTDQLKDAGMLQHKVQFFKEMEKSGVPFSAIMCGGFYEALFSEMFEFDWKAGKVTLMNGGNAPIRRTAVADIPKAVAMLLRSPDPPRVARIASEIISDREAVRVFEKVFERKFEIENKSSKDYLERSKKDTDQVMKFIDWLHSTLDESTMLPVNMQIPGSMTVRQYAELLKTK